MELAIERTSLLNGLSLVQGIVERRTTVPILGNVLLESKDSLLQLDATDLEVGIRTSIACNSTKPGTTTLNARKLFEIVREAEAAEVLLRTLDKDWVELKCGRAKFKMMGLDPRSFPAMPKQGEGAAAKGAQTRKPLKAELGIAADVLAAMIDRTIFSVSPDETRYNLSGVYIESPNPGTARMVATDGHRLSMIERAVEDFKMEGGAILPRKGLAELRKLLDSGGEAGVKLALESQLGWIKRGPTELSMRLIEGEFPDYRGVVPKESKYMVKVSRDSLHAAIKRAAIFSSERYHGVKLTLADGGITISSTTPELGEANETIDADFKGEEFSVGFNSAYLLQALNVIPAESDVILGLSDEVSPGAITTPTDTGYKYVVMPMRL
ncbi:MAG TPA: DNA polymerase III subunit beta [Candidatus Binataceae bacterium]|nr:DNA polymerase III subunit beta [Candidatus Binataceae bacterium]